jgi:hypothetical protein
MRTMKGVSKSRPNGETCSEGGGRMRKRSQHERERRMLKDLRDWELADEYGVEEPPRCCASHNRLPGDALAGILHW